MTDRCSHRRTRFATPVALVVGAMIISGTSAVAAAKITGKQIKNETVTTKDIKNGSLQGIDVRDGSLEGVDVRDGSLEGVDVKDGSIAAGDLAAGLANKLESTRTKVGTSVDLDPVATWQWALAPSDLVSHKVTEMRRFTVSGIVGYGSASAVDIDVAVCSSVNGGTVTYVGSTYGTVRVLGRVNAPVQGEVLASGVTLKIGPCVRATSAVASSLSADVSSVTTMVTVP